MTSPSGRKVRGEEERREREGEGEGGGGGGGRYELIKTRPTVLPLATSYHQEAIAQELDPKWDNLDKSKCSAEAWWEGGREERGSEERGREEREEGEKGARGWGWRDNAAVLSLCPCSDWPHTSSQ